MRQAGHWGSACRLELTVRECVDMELQRDNDDGIKKCACEDMKVLM